MDDIVLGIATGKSRRGLRHVLSNPDLAGRFATTQVADDHASKPHPSMALQAMTESGAVRGVMIGDTTFDMQMGRAAGLKTIGVMLGLSCGTSFARAGGSDGHRLCATGAGSAKPMG